MFWNKKITLSLIIGLLLSALALYVTFRNIPGHELVSYLKSVNYWWAFPAMGIALISFFIRVIRWQVLLNPVRKTGFWSAYHPLMIGFMVNCLLPGRVGELARPAVFYKREKVAFSKVLATVGVERVFDVLVLILSFVVVYTGVEISSSLNLPFGDYQLNKATLEMSGMTTLKLLLALVLCIAAFSIRQSRSFIKHTILRLPDLFFLASNSFKEMIREKFCVRMVRIIDNVAVALELLKSPKKVLLCLVLSLLVWVVAGWSYYVMAYGCPGVDLSFVEMYAMMIILCFFILLPSAPGYWGLWEAGGVFGLLLFGVPANEAAGFTLANHVFQMVPVIILGLASSVITGVNIVRIAYNKNAQRGTEA